MEREDWERVGSLRPPVRVDLASRGHPGLGLADQEGPTSEIGIFLQSRGFSLKGKFTNSFTYIGSDIARVY